MKEFKDKVALVTGGANGFGKAFAIEAAKRGMKLAVVDIDDYDLFGIAAVLRKLGAEVLPILADVSLYEDVKMSVDKTMETYGQIDILFCNAGVAPSGDILNLPVRDWEWTVNTNLTSHGYYYREVLPIMAKQGTPCHVMATASIAGMIHGIGINPAYSATKHGAVGLAEDIRALCRVNKYDNIGVSVYCPGFIQTDLHHCERHRPARYACPEDPYYTSEYYHNCRRRTSVSILTGTPIDPVGAYLFKAIEENQMYIMPHIQYLPYIEGRHRAIEKDAELPDGGEGNPERNFKGQVALITGAASGFGYEFAKEAASRGMKLSLVDIDGEKLEKVKAEFDSTGVPCIAFHGDTSVYEEVVQSVKNTMDTFGQIDVLFNNAGVAVVGDAMHVPHNDWDWAIGVNLLGQVYYYREVLPIMIKQGTPANIVSTSSVAGILPGFAKVPTYTATKHAAVGLGESVALMLRDMNATNIKISMFCPGFIQTDLHHSEDHRPERFADPANPYYQSEYYKARRAGLDTLITTGTPIDPVGKRLFKAMEEGQKYILTHAKHQGQIKARHQEIEEAIKRGV